MADSNLGELMSRLVGAPSLLLGALVAQWSMKRLKARWTTTRTALALIGGLAIAIAIPLMLAWGGADRRALYAPALGLVLACGFAFAHSCGYSPFGTLLAAVCLAASCLHAHPRERHG